MRLLLKIFTNAILLFSLICQSQDWNRIDKEEFFFAGTEIDPRNAIFGSHVNGPALDGVLNVGYRNQSFQLQASYENFNAIKFSSFGFWLGYVFNYKGNFNYALLGGLSMIQRKVRWLQQDFFSSVSISGQIEYHFYSRLYLSLRAEGRFRGDLNNIKPSGFTGIGVKF